VIDTIYEWENQIVNSLIISDELGGNITNGIVEAKNNVAKTIIKSSYGKTILKNLENNF
jgi:transposase